MKNRRIICIAAVFGACLISAASHAETWQETLRLSEKNNNELRSAEKNLESSQWSYKKSLTPFLPQVSAFASLGGTETGSSSATSSSYGLSATQSIFKGFANINAARRAYSQLEYSRADLAQKRSDVFYAVRSAFTDLLMAEKDLKLQEKILARREENAKLIDLLYDNGKEDKGNMMLTLADVESSKTAVSQAKRNLELAKLKLSQLTGTEIRTAEAPDTDVMNPADIDIRNLSETSPSYQKAKYTFDTAAISADEASAGLLPDISASGNVRRSGSDWPPQSESKSWSLNLSYSFFPGGSNIAEKIIKEIEKEKAWQNFEQTKKDLFYSVKSACDNLANKIEALNVSSLYLKASTERAKIARTKYINGLMIYDDWDRTENSYITAERDFLSARKNALIAEAAWQNSYGGWIK